MITGDIKETAQAIGKEIGILKEEEFATRSFTGAEFDALSKEKQTEILASALSHNSGLIFARTEPRHKRDLVKSLSALVN